MLSVNTTRDQMLLDNTESEGFQMAGSKVSHDSVGNRAKKQKCYRAIDICLRVSVVSGFTTGLILFSMSTI